MRTVSTHCKKCCAKIPDLSHMAVRCFWHGCTDRHGADSNSAVRFFVYGGILALPYQFYHHAHKMLCDLGQVFLSSFPMPTTRVAVCDCADHPVWFLLCLLCCAVSACPCYSLGSTVLTLIECAHVLLCSIRVCSMCVSCCVSGRRWWLVKVADRRRLRWAAW